VISKSLNRLWQYIELRSTSRYVAGLEDDTLLMDVIEILLVFGGVKLRGISTASALGVRDDTVLCTVDRI